jgi:uncharacterized protein YodC (DUF2158 family)
MPEDTALTVGDTVCLNSGGDLMTVVSIDQESVTCAWLVKGAVKSYTFPVKALKKSDGLPSEITFNIGKKLPGNPSA